MVYNTDGGSGLNHGGSMAAPIIPFNPPTPPSLSIAKTSSPQTYFSLPSSYATQLNFSSVVNLI